MTAMLRLVLVLLATLAATPARAVEAGTLSTEDCHRLTVAMQTYGYDLVLAGAQAIGYTQEQLRYALNRCATPRRPLHKR